MLETLIISKTRIKILIKFFLNSNSISYLRGLESEFCESTNAIRLELNRFEEAGLLTSELNGNKKEYRANTQHPLFPDIHSILLKYVGLDKIIEKVISKLGKVDSAFITGDLAKGKNSEVIDLILVGDGINMNYLVELISKVEKIIKKKIRFLIYSTEEGKSQLDKDIKEDIFLLWKA